MLRIVLNITIVVLSITCLIVGLVFIGSSDSTVDCSKAAEVPVDISVTHTGQYSVISWQVPEENQGCAVIYTLQYSIDSAGEIVISTTDSYYSIARLDACSELSLNLWVANEEGVQSDGDLTFSLNYIPTSSDIPSPTNIEVSNITEGFQVSWLTPEGLEKCTVSFHITMVANTEISSDDTTEENYIVTEDKYCFTSIITVATVINAVTGSSVSITYEDNKAVTGLVHTISPDDSSKLIVSWDGHPKEESCSIGYIVTYSIEDEDEETITTSDHEATFDITYCVDASVSVTAHRLLIFQNDAATIDVTECNEI